MIFVTGDTHGDVSRFFGRMKKFIDHEDNIVIILGDFGMLWDDFSTVEYCLQGNKQLKQLARLKCRFYFVDGNHENFNLLNKFPIIEKDGGKMHQITDNVFHLMRGEVFTIEHKDFLVLGGADSTDKPYRTDGKSWWKEETITEEDLTNAKINLCDRPVDFVLTHCAPSTICRYLSFNPKTSERRLEELFYHLPRYEEYWRITTKWFFGHYHKNFNLIVDEINFIGLYEDIVEVK